MKTLNIGLLIGNKERVKEALDEEISSFLKIEQAHKDRIFVLENELSELANAQVVFERLTSEETRKDKKCQ